MEKRILTENEIHDLVVEASKSSTKPARLAEIATIATPDDVRILHMLATRKDAPDHVLIGLAQEPNAPIVQTMARMTMGEIGLRIPEEVERAKIKSSLPNPYRRA